MDILTLSLPAHGGVFCPVLLSDAGKRILVDCGEPQMFPELELALRKAGATIESLTHLVITHHDQDHVGCLPRIKEANPSLAVASSVQEAAYISGKKLPLRQSLLEKALEDPLTGDHETIKKELKRFRAQLSVPVDYYLEDGVPAPFCPDLIPISTPGHMPGHISLYIESQKTLISGDALMASHGELLPPSKKYTLDYPCALCSLAKLQRYPIETVLCFHGGAVTGSIPERLDFLLQQDGSQR